MRVFAQAAIGEIAIRKRMPAGGAMVRRAVWLGSRLTAYLIQLAHHDQNVPVVCQDPLTMPYLPKRSRQN